MYEMEQEMVMMVVMYGNDGDVAGNATAIDTEV